MVGRKAVVKIAQHDIKVGTKVIAYPTNLYKYYRILFDNENEEENKIAEVVYALSRELPEYWLIEEVLEFYE